jgi:cellulose biosynthesis protein BcsQ
VALIEPPGTGLLRFYFAAGAAAPPRILPVPEASAGGDAWFWDALGQVGSPLDRLLIDAGPGWPAQPCVWASQSGVRIAVLNPDLRSVVRLAPLVETIREHEPEGGDRRPVYLLLNQYDSAIEVHREIRERLDRQYGGSLIPVAIHRSDLVATALAKGVTVVDEAPDSEVARDCARLAEWLRPLSI